MDDFGQLLDRARTGDAQAMDALLQRHLMGLRAYVRLRSGKLVRAKESCSDLVQSVCLEVLGDLGDFKALDERAFRQWLYTVALRKILDRRKYYVADKRDAGREVQDDDNLRDVYQTIGTPSRHAMAVEEMRRLEDAFDELPDDYREVITLHRIVGLSHREIAERMGRNEQAVRKLMSRAKARLARLMDRGG